MQREVEERHKIKKGLDLQTAEGLNAELQGLRAKSCSCEEQKQGLTGERKDKKRNLHALELTDNNNKKKNFSTFSWAVQTIQSKQVWIRGCKWWFNVSACDLLRPFLFTSYHNKPLAVCRLVRVRKLWKEESHSKAVLKWHPVLHLKKYYILIRSVIPQVINNFHHLSRSCCDSSHAFFQQVFYWSFFMQASESHEAS